MQNISTLETVGKSIPEPRRLSFNPIAPQGFGDRHNSWAWSMLWWQGKLYVGTNRAFLCAERAALSAAFPLLAKFPFIRYPPEDPDTACTPSPIDLPLQAEIWRWTPETDHWERVYQSPQDVPIPNHPGKYVACEVGFRDMASFVEPDGTEALYVSSVNAQFIYRHVPPPALLRSTDGLIFKPVPQEPETYLGELEESTFRTITVYKNRLFVVGGGTIYGDGILLESSNPAAGNDHFKPVSPPEMRVFEMVPFNDYLYLGLRDTKRGYAVVKTNVSGSSPYTFTPVITNGAFLSPPSQSVISMCVFKGRLYIGTDGPAELIRINPDDSWDLVIGTPRKTPDGWKYPISGLDAGFHNWLNGHIWRMHVHDERLYLGTMNTGTHLRRISNAEPVLEPNYGFDLYETTDGCHYVPITTNGFGDKFAFGVRSLASTPYGLFLGTANSWYGLQIWQGTAATTTDQRPETIRENSPLPVVHRRSEAAPERLEVEYSGGKIVLSWEHSAVAKQFRIWRVAVSDERHNVEANPFLKYLLRMLRAFLALRPNLYVAPLPDKLWIPGRYLEIGTTEHRYFEDLTADVANKRYLYYVQAESPGGNLFGASNIVAAPPLQPAITFDYLSEMFADLANSGKLDPVEKEILEQIRKMHISIKTGDTAPADTLLPALFRRLSLSLPDDLDPLFVEEFQRLLQKLARRIVLSQTGLIDSELL